MFLYSLVIVVIVSLDSFSQATPCENCGTCIPILEYCNVHQEDANVMENLVIDQSISAGARASFRPSPNAPSDLKIQEESRERCLIETFLAVGRDRPSRNLKCQVKFQNIFIHLCKSLKEMKTFRQRAMQLFRYSRISCPHHRMYYSRYTMSKFQLFPTNNSNV